MDVLAVIVIYNNRQIEPTTLNDFFSILLVFYSFFLPAIDLNILS